MSVAAGVVGAVGLVRGERGDCRVRVTLLHVQHLSQGVTVREVEAHGEDFTTLA